jgi:hypothetical protein
MYAYITFIVRFCFKYRIPENRTAYTGQHICNESLIITLTILFQLNSQPPQILVKFIKTPSLMKIQVSKNIRNIYFTNKDYGRQNWEVFVSKKFRSLYENC